MNVGRSYQQERCMKMTTDKTKTKPDDNKVLPFVKRKSSLTKRKSILTGELNPVTCYKCGKPLPAGKVNENDY